MLDYDSAIRGGQMRHGSMVAWDAAVVLLAIVGTILVYAFQPPPSPGGPNASSPGFLLKQGATPSPKGTPAQCLKP